VCRPKRGEDDEKWRYTPVGMTMSIDRHERKKTQKKVKLKGMHRGSQIFPERTRRRPTGEKQTEHRERTRKRVPPGESAIYIASPIQSQTSLNRKNHHLKGEGQLITPNSSKRVTTAKEILSLVARARKPTAYFSSANYSLSENNKVARRASRIVVSSWSRKTARRGATPRRAYSFSEAPSP